MEHSKLDRLVYIVGLVALLSVILSLVYYLHSNRFSIIQTTIMLISLGVLTIIIISVILPHIKPRDVKPVEVEYDTKIYKKHKLSRWYIVYGMILLTAVIFLPTKVMPYQVETQYEGLEEYTESVPYEVTEEYVENIPIQEQQPYQEQVCNNRNANYNRDINSEWILGSCFANIYCKITNLENQPVTFRYTITAGPSTGDEYKYGPYSDTIGAYTLNTESTSFNLGCNQFKYNCIVEPGQIKECNLVTNYKTITDYKPTVKTRPTTKYRDETKYRNVLKTKNETKYKEVNWLFGFNAIIKFRDLDNLNK